MSSSSEWEILLQNGNLQTVSGATLKVKVSKVLTPVIGIWTYQNRGGGFSYALHHIPSKLVLFEPCYFQSTARAVGQVIILELSTLVTESHPGKLTAAFSPELLSYCRAFTHSNCKKPPSLEEWVGSGEYQSEASHPGNRDVPELGEDDSLGWIRSSQGFIPGKHIIRQLRRQLNQW